MKILWPELLEKYNDKKPIRYGSIQAEENLGHLLKCLFLLFNTTKS